MNLTRIDVRLILMRHGKSGHDHPELSDHDRPLKMRGILNSIRMGQLLTEKDIKPDLIVSSTAQRAKHTAELVVKHGQLIGTFLLKDELYHAAPELYVEEIKKISGDYPTRMLVGHNPGLEELLSRLTGQSMHMSTAAVAVIDLAIADWQALTPDSSGKLVAFYKPKDLEPPDA